MKMSGNTPPAVLPNRGKYMFEQDIPNLQKLYGLRLQFPSNFPQSSLKAQRILTAIRMMEKDKVEEASRQFWVGLHNIIAVLQEGL